MSKSEGGDVRPAGRFGNGKKRMVEKKAGIPLQTLRADIDFAREKAHLPYGDIGIKVWTYKGEKI